MVGIAVAAEKTDGREHERKRVVTGKVIVKKAVEGHWMRSTYHAFWSMLA